MADTGILTPRQVFARLIDGISTSPREELAELYAEDTVVDLPFDHPEPTRLEGRETLRRHFAGTRPFTLTATNIVVHDTDDPEVIIAEFDYIIRIPDTDRSLQVANIQVLGVRDGLIAWSRDFHNHEAIARFLRT